ncbi:hypothetical protein OG762_16400 [Streptomyces sp. NBC_01136]|uniref:hypothetical protein n=1 Tax=Streptomyces sp. NBC_01136 TaxID=2903754 RepID=UPI00386D5D26|nr:hypothetical protein OG762_16400 [Streptomyces sp. NBC_01136]
MRIYNPASGRFVQIDPIVGASASAYDYCNANAVSCADIAGMIPGWLKSEVKDIVKWGVGALVAAAVAAVFPEAEPWVPSIAGCITALVISFIFTSGSWGHKLVDGTIGCIASLLGKSPGAKALEKKVAHKTAKLVESTKEFIWDVMHCYGWC